jgi:uncharacterized protein (UPF0332 family)
LPTKDQHIQKAERNEKFAKRIAENTGYFDWAVTVLFYAGLHYIDAVLAVSRIDPHKHEERQDSIQKNDTLRRVYSEYRMLETLSRNARYYAVEIDANDWHAADVEFNALRAHLRTRMNLPG